MLRRSVGEFGLCFLTFSVLFFLLMSDTGTASPFDQTKIIKIMTELMKKPYERSVRPLYNEAPLYIRTGLFIHSIHEFNEKTQDIIFQLTLKQSWFEPRLTFNAGLVPNDTIQLTPEQGKLLWNPNTVIQNEKKPAVILPGHEYVRLTSEGHISTSSRLVATIACPKHYSTFPFDTRTCNIILASYSYDKQDLFFEWENDQTGMKTHLRASEFQVTSFKATTNTDPRYPDTSLVFKLHLRRNWEPYYRSFFSPMIIFTMLSLLTLWFGNRRFGVLVNFVNLPLMNIFLGIQKRNERIPSGPDRTAMDLYCTMAYFFVFASLTVNILLMYFVKLGEGDGVEETPSAPDSSPPESPIPVKKDVTKLIFEVEEGVADTEDSGSKPARRRKRKSSWVKSVRKNALTVRDGVNVLCQHAHWILLVSFILCNVFYWGVYLSEIEERSK